MTKHAVELLGAKQMYLVSGIHKSGVPYQWNKHPCDLGVSRITRITRKQVDDFFVELNILLDVMGYERITDRGATVDSGGVRKSSVSPATRVGCSQRI
jgi:hypothetical protein